MSEMIERAAQAIYESRNGRGTKPWAQREWAHKQPYLEDARVAIKSVREPTVGMIEAGVTADTGKTLGERVANCHRAIIDEALR